MVRVRRQNIVMKGAQRRARSRVLGSAWDAWTAHVHRRLSHAHGLLRQGMLLARRHRSTRRAAFSAWSDSLRRARWVQTTAALPFHAVCRHGNFLCMCEQGCGRMTARPSSRRVRRMVIGGHARSYRIYLHAVFRAWALGRACAMAVMSLRLTPLSFVPGEFLTRTRMTTENSMTTPS